MKQVILKGNHISKRFLQGGNGNTVLEDVSVDIYEGDFTEYTKVGTIEATDEFVAAVEENPVLEGWDNKIVLISDGE